MVSHWQSLMLMRSDRMASQQYGVQIAAPYQYKQQGSDFKRLKWTLNLLMRLALSKVLPGSFAPPVAMPFATGAAGMDGPWQTMYQDVLRAGANTTRRLHRIAAVALFSLICGFGYEVANHLMI